MWHLQNNMNEHTKQKYTHKYREQTDDRLRGRRLGDWEKEVKKYRLAVTKHPWGHRLRHGEYSQ